MKMHAYAEIIQKLDEELSDLKNQTQNVVFLAEKAIGLCEQVILKMRENVNKNGFNSTKEEIHFFRDIKPKVESKLIYYFKLFDIETNRPSGGKEIQNKYLENELEKLQSFFNSNKEFCQYYWRNQTHFDHLYFTRGNAQLRIHADNLTNITDPQFSTGYDLTVANIKAKEMLIKYLINELEKIKNDESTGSNIRRSKIVESKATWTGSNVYLVELIYALHTVDVINNGKIEIKELTLLFGNMFNVKLDDVYRTFTDIQMRKNSKTKFLEQLVLALKKRIEENDEKNSNLKL